MRALVRRGMLVAILATHWPALAIAASPPAARRDAGDDVVDAAHNYRDTLERLAAIREEEAAKASALVDRYAELYARGVVSRRELEDTARLAGVAREREAATRREMATADTLIAEAEARRQLAALGPIRPGEYRATGALVAFHGTRGWTLGDLPGIERFFVGRFGRVLPVSAVGQTPVHDQLGFDHARAADVALHPDTAEGGALMAYLRERGIPFIAFRGAVSGAATGAHIHIGPPSERRSPHTRLGVSRAALP